MLMRCECFFFKQKTAYEMRISDWSSDVCSSDLTKDTVAGIAELEDVAGDGLDREVFVDVADDDRFGFQHDVVVAGVRDGSARHHRGHPPAGPPAQAPVHGVAVQVEIGRAHV